MAVTAMRDGDGVLLVCLASLRNVGFAGVTRRCTGSRQSAPHHEVQLPRTNTALPSPELGYEGGFQPQSSNS